MTWHPSVALQPGLPWKPEASYRQAVSIDPERGCPKDLARPIGGALNDDYARDRPDPCGSNRVYLAVVGLTMFVLPVTSVLIEHALVPGEPIIFLIGRWFVFWGVGVRLTLAGLRQLFQPGFTATQIFHMKSEEALPLVRELGVANIATGAVALLSLAIASFILPVSISSAIFYGAAGVRHVIETDRSRNENIAMASDLFLFLVLTIFLVGSWVSRAR